MNSIDFQDPLFKLPANERLQQQRQQQPTVNQQINIQHDQRESEARIDRPEQKDAAGNIVVDQRKPDREFRGNKKRRKQEKDKKPSAPGEGRLIDLEG